MSDLIERARKDRAAAEAAGDLGLVVFIDGFIAGAIEMSPGADVRVGKARQRLG